jgi:hypothetical protein
LKDVFIDTEDSNTVKYNIWVDRYYFPDFKEEIEDVYTYEKVIDVKSRMRIE